MGFPIYLHSSISLLIYLIQIYLNTDPIPKIIIIKVTQDELTMKSCPDLKDRMYTSCADVSSRGGAELVTRRLAD